MSRPAPHGWIVLDKPRGLGSTQAVAAVKRNLRQGGYPKVKIGHGGTLDPLAEGVLPIALGEATKLCGRMLDASKTYEFTISFGEETDTLDAEGAVVARSGHRPPIAAIAAVLEHFAGEIEQIPPAFSALKVDGKRAYDRARAGEDMEMKARRVTVHSLDLASGGSRPPVDSAFSVATGRPDPFDPQMPLELADSITLVAKVSKGTYIRSLVRDIAHALGTVGHVAYLRRTQAGPFREEQAISLDKLDEIGKGAPLEDLILPLEAGLDGIPAFTLESSAVQAVRQGRVITGLPQSDGLYCAMAGKVPVALLEITSGAAKIVRGFNIPDTAE